MTSKLTATASATAATAATTLFAYDGSGSTGGSQRYHTAAQRLYQELPAADTQILFWDSAARIITPAELLRINTARQGNGGTCPELIAHHIVRTGFHGHLVILTDGQVSSSSVDACDRILPAGWTFASVRVLMVDTGGAINMSVGCPFTRSSPHTVQKLTEGDGTHLESAQTVTAVNPDMIALLDRLDAIATVAEWQAVATALEPVIIARTMGTTGDPTLRDRLLALKKRIQRAEAVAKGASGTVATLQTALDARDMETALTMADLLTREYYGDDDGVDISSWSGKLNRLVSMCEGALRGTFDLSNISGAIQSDRARRAPTATATPTTAAELSEPSAPSDGAATAGAPTAFVCPITMDSEADVVLMVAAESTPLLGGGVDKDTVNALANCPLFLFRYPELLALFQTRIDHPLSLRALKEAEAVGASITESPMTRRPLLGGLCLGPHDDHVAATNWTLAQLTAGGRRLGNPDLWFAALWLLVKRGAIPYLSSVLPQMTAHMTYRLRTSKAPLSLLGAPEFPTTRVPLNVAVWYAVASSALSPPPAREVVRAHLPYVEELMEIAALAGHPYPAGVPLHLVRLRVALAALAWSKRDEAGLRGTLRALYQAAVCVEDKWLAIDGPASAGQQVAVMSSLPRIFRSLSYEELVAIGQLVNPGKSAADVAIPFNWTAPPLPAATVTWAYGLLEYPRIPVAICPATCRPYFHVPPTGQEWPEVATAAIGGITPDKMLPIHAQYGHYVVKHGAFPTKSELLLHLWHRVTAQRRPTLPAQIDAFVEDILADYREVATSLTPHVFAVRFLASVKRVDRARMEASAV
jgi:hypothetical protein